MEHGTQLPSQRLGSIVPLPMKPALCASSSVSGVAAVVVSQLAIGCFCEFDELLEKINQT